jgi:hypothetical protein
VVQYFGLSWDLNHGVGKDSEELSVFRLLTSYVEGELKFNAIVERLICREHVEPCIVNTMPKQVPDGIYI